MLVALGAGAWYWLQIYKYRTSPEYRAEQYFKDLERRYREDPYGGSTPEETLQLFIDALKKGDVELGSKYFPADEQAKRYAEIKSIKEVGKLSSMISDLTKLEAEKVTEEKAYFVITNNERIVVLQVILVKGINGKWKITEL